MQPKHKKLSTFGCYSSSLQSLINRTKETTFDAASVMFLTRYRKNNKMKCSQNTKKTVLLAAIQVRFRH